MQCSAKVVLDSVSKDGARLCTLELTYPRFIHGELMTHRAFSRNASSSRAIPVSRMLRQVIFDPVIPWHWGSNKPGMQAGDPIPSDAEHHARDAWREAAKQAAMLAERINYLGVHKQICNRLLEPFQLMKTIVTATEWDNFFALRTHNDAEPHFRDLAVLMKGAMDASVPVRRDIHSPYVDYDSRFTDGAKSPSPNELEHVFMVSSARCARVSYMNHDGSSPDEERDAALAQRLLSSRHMSPFEHAAVARPGRAANFNGWMSYRYIVELR